MKTLDATLFGFAAQADIESAISKVTRTPRIVYDYKIELDGQTFDAKDILETLEEACDGDTYITNEKMVVALIKLGVILHGGNNRWMTGAEKGQNYNSFVELLRRKIKLLALDNNDRVAKIEASTDNRAINT